MKARELIFDGEVAYVPLTRGYYAIIDAEDAPVIGSVNWCVISNKASMMYAIRSFAISNGKYQTVCMHRSLTDAPKGMDVDHINHDSLDNRKHNLRVCSRSQNQQNQRKCSPGSSHLKGVYWHSQRGKWSAQINANGKQMHLGLHNTEQEAHQAYCKASKELHREYGCTISNSQINQHENRRQA